jgi:hypothetical protein
MNGNEGGGMLWGGAIWSSCSALALLTAMGCGEITSLGNNTGTAGGGGSTSDDADGGGSGRASGGTSPNTDAGGRADAGQTGGGSGGKQAGGGHDGGQPAGGNDGGGQAGGGGHGGDGGQGGDVDVAPLPYPLNPTVPISADCSCADPASVCNAAGECVPRCEPGGVCAVWRVDRDVLSMLTSGDTLYYAVAAGHDDLGNPLPGEAGQESLWKVHYPDSTPTKLAMLAHGHANILARFGGKTYVDAGRRSVLAIGDDGSVVERDWPDAAFGVSVSAAGVFTVGVEGSIDHLAIGPDGTFGADFVNVVQGPGDVANDIDLSVFVSDRLWRQHGSQLCSFDLANLQAAPHCEGSENAWVYGATGGRIVTMSEFGGGYISEHDVDEHDQRILWVPPDSQRFTGTMAAGFITGWMWDYPDLGASMLGRFPTEGIAKKPTPLIGQDVVRAMAEVSGDRGVSLMPPAVTSDAIYWTQWFNDPVGPGASRYIFRAPLPQ